MNLWKGEYLVSPVKSPKVQNDLFLNGKLAPAREDIEPKFTQQVWDPQIVCRTVQKSRVGVVQIQKRDYWRTFQYLP